MKISIYYLAILLLLLLLFESSLGNSLRRHHSRHRSKHRSRHKSKHKSYRTHNHKHSAHSLNPLITNISPLSPINLNSMNQNELIQALPQVKDIKNNRFNKLLLSNLNQTQKKDNNNSIVFAKSIKTLFEGMYQGYNQLLRKFHVHAKVVYDPVRKTWFKVASKLPEITCSNYHAVLLNPEHIKELYRSIHGVNKSTYKTQPKKILKSLENVILEVGNNCENMINVIEFIRKQFKELTFLKKKNYHNPWLLLQTLSARNNFMYSWGNFNKMGMYIGHVFAWYKIYKPPKEVVNQQNNKLLQAALSLLKKDKIENKTN